MGEGEAKWCGCPGRQCPRGGKVNVLNGKKKLFGTALQILND